MIYGDIVLPLTYEIKKMVQGKRALIHWIRHQRLLRLLVVYFCIYGITRSAGKTEHTRGRYERCTPRATEFD